MKYYLKHIRDLYKRPTLNGLDGYMELRAASPFELFLDLIFVIALSKLSLLLELQTILGFVEATLLLLIIYSLWFTLATYTVMFMKKEINYWTRAMIFIVMIPLIFFLSISSLDSHLQVTVFCLSLAVSKILLSIIFRDSIVNAPINHIVVSNVYLTISRSQLISALLLLFASFVQNKLLFLTILFIIAIREVVLIPIKQKKIISNSFGTMLINKNLFMERQLLFIILIFGESLISIISNIANEDSSLAILHIIIVFSIMFLFYVRISEETEYNPSLMKKADSLTYWVTFDYIIFILFFILSSVPHAISTNGQLPLPYLYILVTMLLYLTTEHMHLNYKNLKLVTNPVDAIFYKLDIKMLYLMYFVILLIVLFHNTVSQVYILTLVFFGLHVIALPFRSHLIEHKCEFASYLEEHNNDTQ